MRSFQGLRPTRSSAFGSCWTLSFLGQKQKSKRLTKVFVLAKRTKHALGRARWPRLRRKVQAEVDRIGEHSLRNLRVPYRDPSLLAFCEKSTGNSLSLGDETLLHARSVDDQTDHVMHADAGSFNDRFSLANARKFDQLTVGNCRHLSLSAPGDEPVHDSNPNSSFFRMIFELSRGQVRQVGGETQRPSISDLSLVSSLNPAVE